MSFSVQEVAQLLKKAKENEKPYVFFTGAGCSIKADVPSATGLIKEICKKFPIQVKKLDPEKDKYNYGKYMSALDKAERRQLLKPHIIDNNKINWAHIALACLMQAGYIQRVLTFNFDSILSRACSLLGLHPSIYDFATANPHLYHLINDPSIVHLHGQGTGFVQLNTDEETEQHTKKLGEFIAATLNTNPSLFIGYSGNADAFFPLLEEKYSEQHRLIWTGTKNTIEELESESVKNFLNKNSNLTHYIGNTFADDFLVQIAKELDCFPPELFSNPYKFLNQQLENVQEYPLGDGLDILANLTDYLKEQSQKPLIESLYTAFIHKYPSKESTEDLGDEEIDQIMWAYTKQAQLLYNKEDNKDSFDLYKKAISIKDNHMGCLLNYALNLAETGQNKTDIEILEKSLNLFERAYNTGYKNAFIIGQHALVIANIASIQKNEIKLSQAFNKYEEALKLDPNHLDNLGNYSNALETLFQLSKDYKFLEQAIQNHITALQIAPDHLLHLNHLTSRLLMLYHFKPSEELLEKAFKAIQSALIQSPNKTYNLAYYYSISKNTELAKSSLLHAEQHKTLPDFQHLSQDKDLDNVRKEPWFIDLLNRLKEEATQKAS